MANGSVLQHAMHIRVLKEIVAINCPRDVIGLCCMIKPNFSELHFTLQARKAERNIQ